MYNSVIQPKTIRNSFQMQPIYSDFGQMVTWFEQHQSGRIKVNKSHFFLTFSPSAYKLELSGFIYLFSSWQQVLFGCKFFLYTLDKQCILRILIRNTGVHMYNLLTITENFFYIYPPYFAGHAVFRIKHADRSSQNMANPRRALYLRNQKPKDDYSRTGSCTVPSR